MEQRIKYRHVLALQPDGRRDPVATLAYYLREDNIVIAACALRSRHDAFRRDRGRLIALGRLEAARDGITQEELDPHVLPRHVTTWPLEAFKKMCSDVLGKMRREVTTYQRARKIMATWFAFDDQKL